MAVERAVVVLLRAVNVGGTGKVPMAALREALAGAGLKDVRTYIQSGNVVCRSRLTPAKVAAEVHGVIQTQFALDVPSVGLSTSELSKAIEQWPVPEGAAAKTLHCIVFEKALNATQTATVENAVAAARATGSEDFAEVVGRFVYLYTPGGIGESKLARQVSTPKLGGTARNWNTLKTLLEMARTTNQH